MKIILISLLLSLILINNFVIVSAQYFDTWLERSGIFTIGKKERLSIYIRNTGEDDSFKIKDIVKSAKKGGDDVPQLLDVSWVTDEISLKSGETGVLNPTLIVLGPIDEGYITFTIEDTGLNEEDTNTISITAAFPTSLPEFNFIGTIQILIISVIILIISNSFHFRKSFF